MNQALMLMALSGGLSGIGNMFSGISTGGLSSILPLMLFSKGGSSMSSMLPILGILTGNTTLTTMGLLTGATGSSRNYTRASVRAAYYKGLSRSRSYRRY